MDDFVELEGFPERNYTLRHYSLMNSLLAVLNSTSSDASENVLARYFLEHFDHLEQLNVYDVAEECYTSRSTIRRFCQSIGFENFSDIKSSAYEWSIHQEFFVGYTDHEDFRAHLVGAIDDMVEVINELVDDASLDDLVELVHGADDILLVASDFSSMEVREFQQSMLIMHKIVRILTDSSGDESMLGSMGEDDLVIVISASGSYARVVRRDLVPAVAQKALVTLNHDELLASDYDLVFYLSHEDYRYRGQRTVYAKYGVSYFFDLLYNRYFTTYGKDCLG